MKKLYVVVMMLVVALITNAQSTIKETNETQIAVGIVEVNLDAEYPLNSLEKNLDKDLLIEMSNYKELKSLSYIVVGKMKMLKTVFRFKNMDSFFAWHESSSTKELFEMLNKKFKSVNMAVNYTKF
jgi:hypothetical protein